MPETDILNPAPGLDLTVGDSMNPSYGFRIDRPSTLLRAKAVAGRPWTRETENSGHVFTLGWIGRTLACANRLKQYYEQYEQGFFTIVDWEGGGRHYVGRFTTPVIKVATANNKWDVQNVTFEEVPTVPMVEYPQDWENDSILFYPFDDFGDQKVATLGAWSATGRTLMGKAALTMDDTGVANDWAQFEYRGYGFQLFLMQGPEYGQCQVYLDGTLQSNALGATTIDCYAVADIGPQIAMQQQNVSLDIHRVKVVALGTKNALATAPAISWHSLRVMR